MRPINKSDGKFREPERYDPSKKMEYHKVSGYNVVWANQFRCAKNAAEELLYLAEQGQSWGAFEVPRKELLEIKELCDRWSNQLMSASAFQVPEDKQKRRLLSNKAKMI